MTNRATVGRSVFARDRTTDVWQAGVVTDLGSRLATVRGLYGVIDERIPDWRQSLRALTSEVCVWAVSGEGWPAADRDALWAESDRDCVLRIARAVRLPTKRCDCDGYFAVLITVGELGSAVDGVGSLEAGGALVASGIGCCRRCLCLRR